MLRTPCTSPMQCLTCGRNAELVWDLQVLRSERGRAAYDQQVALQALQAELAVAEQVRAGARPLTSPPARGVTRSRKCSAVPCMAPCCVLEHHAQAVVMYSY